VCPPSDERTDNAALGPDESLSLDLGPVPVVVIDSSTIVRIKKVVRTDDQWALFAAMMLLVEGGRLTFPSHVHREVSREKHPAPGVAARSRLSSTLTQARPRSSRSFRRSAASSRRMPSPNVSQLIRTSLPWPTTCELEASMSWWRRMTVLTAPDFRYVLKML